MPALAHPADVKLLLEVVINGRDTHKLGDFFQRGAAPAGRPPPLYATRADLRDLGLRAPGPDGQLACLCGLAGVTYTLNGPTQTLDLHATDGALLATSLDSPAGARPEPLRTGTGAVLNYDTTLTHAGGQTALRSLVDGRLFTAGGVLDTQYLLATGGGGGAIRLDTTLGYVDPDTLRSYQAGDVINGGLSWTRPVRIGGLQVQSDFAVRPDLVTFPQPLVGGSAAVPSTVDVLVNSVHLLTHSVEAGPFSLNQLPIVSGANTVTVVTRDVLGQESTQNLGFYTSQRLLVPGLAAYSLEAGAMRDYYGLRGEDYAIFVGSGTMRYGLSRLVTLETHAEVAAALGLAGAGAVVNLGQLGLLTASAAGSTRAGHDGAQFAIGAERLTRWLSLSVSVQRATPHYADLASLTGDPPPTRQLRVGAGITLGRAGALNLAYSEVSSAQRGGASARFAQDQFAPGQNVASGGDLLTLSSRAALLTVTYTTRVWGNIEGYATGFHDFTDAQGSGAILSISVPLGQRRSASLSVGSAGRSTYVNEQAAQAAVSPGQIGATLLNQNGMPDRQMLQVGTVTSWGDIDAGIDRTGRSTALRVGQSGSLVVMDGDYFVARPIEDSFAVVDTGLPHVRILQENRPAGTTGQDGKLLLPNLQSFASNRIGLDPASIPVDADLRSASQTIRPQGRTGIVVRYALHRRASATMHLVDEAGHELAVGSVAVLAPAGPPNVVGYDGTAFVRDLKARNTLRVTRTDGRGCRVDFAFHKQGDVRPDLGRLTCHLERPL